MNLPFHGKKVLLRVDFNVPLDERHRITDDTRIRAAIPTIQKILDEGGAVILLSHLGRPGKKRLPDGSMDKERFTLRHLVPRLSELLKRPVAFVDETVGPKARAKAASLLPGEVLLLENVRFNEGETKGDPELAGQLAELADLYVNDAFGTAHRRHASTAVVAEHFPKGKKSFGLLMQRELENAGKVLSHPDRPMTAIIGGAKVSDKLLLFERLITFADKLIAGGGMAYTFIKAQGGKVGASLVEEDRLDTALHILQTAREQNTELLLPCDSVIADRFAPDAHTQIAPSNAIPDGWMGLDIGPRARADFAKAITNSKTILWNGPMGVFEMPAFAKGTEAIARAVAEATRKGAFSLVGGGDSVAALKQTGLDKEVSFVSTGGGALLKFLEGTPLPAVEAMETD